MKPLRLLPLLAAVGLGAAACGGGGLDCRGLACGALPPAVVLTVGDARGGGLSAQAAIANLVLPPTVHDAPATCGPPGAGPSTCSILAHAAGHYELDLGAAGYATQHLAVEVAEEVLGRACCESPYVTARLNVLLSP